MGVMADSRSKLTLSAAARARKRAARTVDPWVGSADYHEKYTAKRAEAQALANELGFDFGMQVSVCMKHWMHFMLPAKQYRYGHETLCEVVHPENVERTQRGHGPSATRPPSVVGPDFHGGPWVGRERAVELTRMWWARWDRESRWPAVVRTVKLLNCAARVARSVRSG